MVDLKGQYQFKSTDTQNKCIPIQYVIFPAEILFCFLKIKIYKMAKYFKTLNITH